MKTLKIALWIAALGCLTAVPFVFLPWTVLENIFLWVGNDPIPDVPVVIYIFRVVCGIIGLIGVFFLILARNPLDYGPMLNLAAIGLIVFGVISFLLGFNIGVQPIVYVGDALSGVILGMIIWIFSSKEKQALSA